MPNGLHKIPFSAPDTDKTAGSRGKDCPFLLHFAASVRGSVHNFHPSSYSLPVHFSFDEKAPEAMYSNLTEVQDRADVIIDFSHPNNLDDILAYAKKNKTKVVFATTGFSKEQLDKIEEASKGDKNFKTSC